MFENKVFVLYLLSFLCIKIYYKGFVMYIVLNYFILIYYLVIKNVVYILMKNFLKVLVVFDWKIWFCFFVELLGFFLFEDK